VSFDPTLTPLAHLPIGGTNLRGNLLVAALRMFKRVQQDLRSDDLCMRRRVRSDEMAQFACQCETDVISIPF
jgi:hypothetical protein